MKCPIAFLTVVGGFAVASMAPAGYSRSGTQDSGKVVWRRAPFAIVRYRDSAPHSWALYHAEKKGFYLLRLWKRYLLVDVPDQEVFDIDPEKIKLQGDQAEFSRSDIPDNPIAISEWKERDVGPMQRIRFRFGQTGSYLDVEIPMLPNGKPAY
ncbi:MAG TPA: hypothetical protein VLV88_11555 [Terriglobales bacterium]|nr:hypothetical protein [Terriglobales bacterium]